MTLTISFNTNPRIKRDIKLLNAFLRYGKSPSQMREEVLRKHIELALSVPQILEEAM